MDVKEIVDIRSLMYSLISAEKNYMVKKFNNEMDFYEMMLTEDWDTVNSERAKEGLPKLSNQDMKRAYLKNMMVSDYKEEKYLEMEYLHFKKMYDVAMKMGFESL